MRSIIWKNLLIQFSIITIVLLVSGEICQAQDASSRPYNTFNLRNLRFGFPSLSARPAAMGGAAIAFSDDPAAITINPAGIGLFARPAVTLSTRFSQNTFSEPSIDCNNNVTHIKDQDRFLDLVHISAVVTFKSFRFATFRENTFDGRFSFTALRPLVVDPNLSAEAIIRQSFASRQTTLRTQVVDNGGSIAWRFSSKFNLGATIRLTRFEYNLSESRYFENEIPTGGGHTCVISTPEADNLYLLQTINEKEWGVGFSGGVLIRPFDRLFVGLVYNKRPSFTLQSRTLLPQYSVQMGDDPIPFPQQEDSSARGIRVSIPDSYGFGLAYRSKVGLNISFDLTRVLYSQLIAASDRIRGSNDPRNLVQDDFPDTNIDPEGAPDITLDDQFQYRAGLEYIVKLFWDKQRFPLRIGYYNDPPQVAFSRDLKARFRDAFPRENTRHHFTAGLGLFINDQLRVDSAVDISSNSLVIMGSSVYTF